MIAIPLSVRKDDSLSIALIRVVYIEERLSLNDEVKVTYLENSRYAVIESDAPLAGHCDGE